MLSSFSIYILSNKPRGTLYIGVTTNLLHCVSQHKNKLIEGITKKYAINRLVYHETFSSIEEALAREKQLKQQDRQGNIDLIETANAEWCDQYEELLVDG